MPPCPRTSWEPWPLPGDSPAHLPSCACCLHEHLGLSASPGAASSQWSSPGIPCTWDRCPRPGFQDVTGELLILPALLWLSASVSQATQQISSRRGMIVPGSVCPELLLQAGTTRTWEKSDVGFWDSFKKSSHFADAPGSEQGTGSM